MNVKYSYYTKIPNYNFFKHPNEYRKFGHFQADIKDFEKFAAAALNEDSEIEFAFLHVYDGAKAGLWKWTRGKGWINLGQ